MEGGPFIQDLGCGRSHNPYQAVMQRRLVALAAQFDITVRVLHVAYTPRKLLSLAPNV